MKTGGGGDSQLRLPAGCLLTAETRLRDISPDICGYTVTFCSHSHEWKAAADRQLDGLVDGDEKSATLISRCS